MKISHSTPQIRALLSNAAAVPNFNHLARPYRWLEYLTFGPFLWRCRVHFLPELSHCRNALVLGDGDGRFTARLLQTNPQIHVTAVDASPGMIASLRRSAEPNLERLTTVIADLRSWKPHTSDHFELVVTHFFLDCLTTGEVAQLTSRLTPSLASNALWLVSEFATPNTRFGRTIAAPLVAALYLAFRFLTGLKLHSLPDYPDALAAAGWRPEAEHSHLSGLLVSQLWHHSQEPFL